MMKSLNISFLKPQNVNSKADDSSVDAHDNDKVLLDEGLALGDKYPKLLEQ